MQTDIIIQARMGATRLPNKVLKKLNGKTLLERVINQTKKTKGISNIIIASTINPNDKKIVAFCKKNNISFFIGSEEDVLDRYVQAAQQFGTEIIVRVTADNPFFEGEIANKLIRKHLKEKNDYTFSTGFPLGSSTEIFTVKSLALANKLSSNPIHHEHIGTYFLDNQKKFKIACLEAPKRLNFPSLRLTVDNKEDFKTAKNILKNLGDDYNILDVIELTKQNPNLLVNKEIQQVYPTEKIKSVFTGNNPLKKISK